MHNHLRLWLTAPTDSSVVKRDERSIRKDLPKAEAFSQEATWWSLGN